MHEIEPYFNWLMYYDPATDERSPFYGKEYNYDQYSDTIYGYYIAPGWDYIGSETLYTKALFVDYDSGYSVLEFIGEWNDTLHNDIMHLKRNVVDEMTYQGINKFILIGENVMNFHGSDDSYYEEWFEETIEGWIVMMNFREFVLSEMSKFNVDSFVNFGGDLDFVNWRTMKPQVLCSKIDQSIRKRLSA